MGQYKSIWTGQQIDDGIDRVNLVITVRVSTEVSDDFAAVEAAWGKKTIIAVYDRNEQQYHSKYSMLCIRRYDDYGDTVYLFCSAVDGRIKTCELRRDSGSGRAMWTIKPDTILVSLPLLNGTLQTLRETLAYMSSEDDGAWSNIPAGSYVYDNDYADIYKADKDIQAGEALVTYGANKNVTKIDNGGLNDLKSALDNKVNTIHPFNLTSANMNDYNYALNAEVWVENSVGAGLTGWATLIVTGSTSSAVEQLLVQANKIAKRKYEYNSWGSWQISNFADSAFASGTGYVRHPDGTMMQWGTVTQNVTYSAWGNAYESSLITLGDFPIPFVGEVPNVQLTLNNSGSACLGVGGGQPTLTGMGATRVFRPNDPGTASVTVAWLAIGRWKA